MAALMHDGSGLTLRARYNQSLGQVVVADGDMRIFLPVDEARALAASLVEAADGADAQAVTS